MRAAAGGARPAQVEARGAAVEPRAGFHWVEWSCELGGTAFMVLWGLSAVCLDFGRGSPVARAIPDASLRLLITGALFAAGGSVVAVLPPGRRSGAHLNPAVTLAFWVTGHVHRHDLGGYVVAQCLGATLGAALLRLLWGADVTASIAGGTTHPGQGIGAGGAIALEALMTALLLTTIFACVSSRRLMRWTPLAVWVVVALEVWQGATYTGTSLNPARSLGPALVSGDLRDLWIYAVAPLAAALAVGAVTRLLSAHRAILTARLFEDLRYPTVLRRHRACA